MTDVVVDTSVWIAHFRKPEARLRALLEADRVLCHPLVLVEIACGTPPAPRKATLRALSMLRQPAIATTAELLDLVERERLHSSGCGAVDVALLVSACLTDGATIWTLDRDLATAARRVGRAFAH